DEEREIGGGTRCKSPGEGTSESAGGTDRDGVARPTSRHSKASRNKRIRRERGVGGDGDSKRGVGFGGGAVVGDGFGEGDIVGLSDRIGRGGSGDSEIGLRGTGGNREAGGSSVVGI